LVCCDQIEASINLRDSEGMALLLTTSVQLFTQL